MKKKKKKNRIGKNQINDISPIRTYCRYEYEENNDDLQNIEKIYDSQSINGNSATNSNIKLKNNIKIPGCKNNLNLNNNNENEVRAKSFDLLNTPSTQIIKDTGNTKTVSIVYKSQKIPNNNRNDNIMIINESDGQNENEHDINKLINNYNDDSNNINNSNNLLNRNKENNNLNEFNENNYIINGNKNKKDDIIKKEKIGLKQTSQNKNIDNNNRDNVIQSYLYSEKKVSNNNLEESEKKVRKNNYIKIEHKEIKNSKNDKEEYPKIVDQEENYDTIREKYESFLRQNDEKEPNLQSKIINSMLSSNDDSYLMNSNSILIQNIQDKIKILKNNNTKDYNNISLNLWTIICQYIH